MIIMYRSSPLTFFIAKRLVDVPWIGMPNLIAGRAVVPELLQKDANASRIETEAHAILSDPHLARRIEADLAAVHAALGERGAAERAADLALGLLGTRS
jgi:lipid-A-disaccharide synthase